MDALDGTEPRGRVRWVRVVLACTLALALLLAIGIAVFVAHGHRRVSAIQAEIRAQGGWLRARDIVFKVPEAPPVADELVSRLEAVLDAAPDVDLVLAGDAEARTAALTWEPARAVWPLVRAHAEYEPAVLDVEDGASALRVWERLGDASASEAARERDRLGVRVAAGLLEPHVDSVRAIGALGPDTCERKLRALAPGEFVIGQRVLAQWACVDIPLGTIPALLLEDRVPEALERWRLAWRMSQRAADTPHVLGHLAWILGSVRALDGLRLLLRDATSTPDLADLVREFRALDVASHERRALEGERALGNDVFDGLDAAEYGMFARIYLTQDRAFYLETLTDSLRQISLPHARAFVPPAEWASELKRHPGLHPVSRLILPKIPEMHESSLALQATLRVAIAAVLAHESGAEAAARATATLVDPFDDAPLRTRIEEDGTFTIWSVGPNLVDDAGCKAGLDEPELDLVWKIAPR